ncbi:hypothetical protein RI367_003679 [Sorochytrium milnesiophthora]
MAAPPPTAAAGDDRALLAQYRAVFKAVNEAQDADGRYMIDLFAQLPPKKLYPDYYEVIKQPISMREIKSKIEKHAYNSLELLRGDFNLMFSNCKRYNQPGSEVYEDANRLSTIMNDAVSAAIAAPPPAVDRPLLKIKLKTPEKVGKTSSGSKRSAASTPSSKKTSEPKPDDDVSALLLAIKKDAMKPFRTWIAKDSVGVNELRSVTEFGATFSWGPIHCAAYYGRDEMLEALIEKGAHVELPDGWYGGTALAWAAYGEQFNTCKLLIDKYGADRYKKNNVGQVPYDLIADKRNPKWLSIFSGAPASSNRKRTSSTSNVASHLQTPSKSSASIPSHSASTDIVYMQRLFDIIAQARGPTGELLSEAFWDLPSRAQYPEYYEVIQRPICLSQIQERLQNTGKRTYFLKHLEQDMRLLFKNAMTFNEEDSQIYTDAKHLIGLFTRQLKKGRASLIGEYSDTPHVSPSNSASETVPAISGKPAVHANNRAYHAGEFVYIKNTHPTVILIQHIVPMKTGQVVFDGPSFIKPDQVPADIMDTAYPTEVVKSETMTAFPDQVLGPCYVMWTRDAMKGIPAGFREEDTLLCEFAYFTTPRPHLQQILDWNAEFVVSPEDPASFTPHSSPFRYRKMPIARIGQGATKIGTGAGVSPKPGVLLSHHHSPAVGSAPALPLESPQRPPPQPEKPPYTGKKRGRKPKNAQQTPKAADVKKEKAAGDRKASSPLSDVDEMDVDGAEERTGKRSKRTSEAQLAAAGTNVLQTPSREGTGKLKGEAVPATPASASTPNAQATPQLASAAVARPTSGQPAIPQPMNSGPRFLKYLYIEFIAPAPGQVCTPAFQFLSFTTACYSHSVTAPRQCAAARLVPVVDMAEFYSRDDGLLPISHLGIAVTSTGRTINGIFGAFPQIEKAVARARVLGGSGGGQLAPRKVDADGDAEMPDASPGDEQQTGPDYQAGPVFEVQLSEGMNVYDIWVNAQRKGEDKAIQTSNIFLLRT